MFVNRLSAVADVGDCADDEECGEAIESEDFAGDEDGGPECVACTCEHGGETERCGERERHSEHSRNEYAKRSTDGEKRCDDTADETGRKRENREGKFQNPVVTVNPGGSSNCVSVSGGVNPKTHVQ